MVMFLGFQVLKFVEGIVVGIMLNIFILDMNQDIILGLVSVLILVGSYGVYQLVDVIYLVYLVVYQFDLVENFYNCIWLIFG